MKRPNYGGYCGTSGCACAEHTSGHGVFLSRHFRSRDWRHFLWKGHNTVDIAQLTVARSQNIPPDMASSAYVTYGHVIDVISCEKVILWRILRNYWLRIGRTYLRTWPLPVTSFPVTWLASFTVKRPYYSGHWTTSRCACAEHTFGHGLFRLRHFRSRGSRHFRWKGDTTADICELSCSGSVTVKLAASSCQYSYKPGIICPGNSFWLPL